MSEPAVLIVEDESDVARDLRVTPKTSGYDVTSIATSGETAIEKTAGRQHDRVLMDIPPTPSMEGIVAAGKVRARFDPVIYRTAYAATKLPERDRITEPDGIFLKPGDGQELHSVTGMVWYYPAIRRGTGKGN